MWITQTTKYYNWIARSQLKVKYSDIYTYLIGSIISYNFSDEKYFFTFIKNIKQEIDILTGYKKRE